MSITTTHNTATISPVYHSVPIFVRALLLSGLSIMKFHVLYNCQTRLNNACFAKAKSSLYTFSLF